MCSINPLKPEKFDVDRLDFNFIDISDKNEEELDEIEESLLLVNTQEYTELRNVDYFIDEDCKLPMSFARISNVEEGIEWYSYYHPELPDDIIPMLARHQFGKLPKKHTRHSTARRQPKPSLTIKNEPITLTFDT